MVCDLKSQSEKTKMSAHAYVESARRMAAFVEESERSNDLNSTRAHLQNRYGLPSGLLYSLRNRPPKSISAELYDRLCAAVESAAEKQMKALEHEIATARLSRTRFDPASLEQATIAIERAREILSEGNEG